FQRLPSLPFFKLNQQAGYVVNKAGLIPIVQYLRIILVQFQKAIILQNDHGLVKLISFLLPFVPAVLMLAYYLLLKLLHKYRIGFFALDLTDKKKAGQCIEIIQV